MDTVDKATRSRIMASVRRRDTGPEILLRHSLHRLGFRYRLNCRNLPGSPDIVFPRLRTVIFVHGCFWHAHGCRETTVPSTRNRFWREKFRANKKRDKRKSGLLLAAGWRVLVVWECALKGRNMVRFDRVISFTAKWLKSKEKFRELANRSN